MVDIDFSKRQKTQGFEPHRDYQVNIQLAKEMYYTWKRSDPIEVFTLIRDSEHHKKCLFTIFFTPDKRTPMGKYAADVWMHQDRESFLKECKLVRSATLKLFEKYQNNFSEQIPIWKQLDEVTIEECNYRNNLKKTTSNVVQKMKSVQHQGIKI